MKVVSDAGELEAVCARVLAAHPSQVASIRAGKKGIVGFLVGQVMKETKGSANPARERIFRTARRRTTRLRKPSLG